MSEERLFALDDRRVHNGAVAAGGEPLTVTTPQSQWAYAVSFPPRFVTASDGRWLVGVDVSVEAGQVGVGILRTDGASFIKEVIVSGAATVNLRIPENEPAGPLVIRNAGSGGAARVRVERIECRLQRAAHGYLVDLEPRTVAAEPHCDTAGVGVFDDANAAAINRARLEWLSRMPLNVAGRRVLDVGAGVGYFSRYYADGGATVVALEGRSENVAILRERHADVEAHVADVQSDDLGRYGSFDIVHCFGLLYHLDSPVVALRRMYGVCRDLLVLETMVCDAREPLVLLVDEPPTINQALAGLGCRPSPSYVAMALNRVGFPYVYGSTTPPDHPDFRFAARNNGEVARNGHNLRCVFVAATRSVPDPHLVPLL